MGCSVAGHPSLPFGGAGGLDRSCRCVAEGSVFAAFVVTALSQARRAYVSGAARVGRSLDAYDKNFADGPFRGRGPAPCGNNLDGIYEGLELSRRERQALGRVAAEVQRQKLVKDFETALLAGDFGGDRAPFAFRGLF